MASCVLLVTFPVAAVFWLFWLSSDVSPPRCQENPDIRARSIVVRPDGSTAAELVSKVMAKSGLTGVGFLSMAVGQEPERTLAPREDVFALASQASSPKDVVLAFHTAGHSEPPRRPLPARGADESGGAEGAVATAAAAVGPGERALAERVAEQEKLIAQLKQIEREQQRIIDSQMRAGEGALSPRQRPLATALEVDKLQMALEEEKRQNAYNKQELEKLRAQKVRLYYCYSRDEI